MPLISLRNVSIGYQGPPLLDDVTLQIEARQRIGLVGRNGAGKTTLLRMLAGQEQPDHGDIVLQQGAEVSLLQQEVPSDLAGPVFDVVAAGAREESTDDRWTGAHQIEEILSRMQLDGSTLVEKHSSGMKRRVLLARALVRKPDVLLLDEPTNHLDVDAIDWLEEFLLRWTGTLIFVTHDRAFLRKMAQRIVEIDRGQLFDWTCDYEQFLIRKEEALEVEAKQNALFDKRLAEEERWIRQGIKARRTRNEGRVRALEKMRRNRAERRELAGAVNLNVQSAERSGNLVARAENLVFSYGDQQIVRDFSITVMRGDKIGVIGPNGAGKTTLLRLILGQLKPQAGSVRLGANLQIAYFDQLREQLDEEATVQDNVGQGRESVQVGGGSQHVIGYLQGFLFSPERARTPVKFLSGGERNRVLLARLFAKPANAIVLDEPTNDLDVETLELLESRLVEFDGTVLVVSHDREFLNNVVTSTIVFESDGVREYVGGYDDWLRQRPAEDSQQPSDQKKQRKPTNGKSKNHTSPNGEAAGGSDPPRRLKYKEKLELEALPERIESLETEIAERHETMAQPDFYQQSGDEIAQATAQLQNLEAELATAYKRWQELEALAS